MRARRVEIEVPVRYRLSGDANWITGWTENISRSGVLFRGPKELDLDTSIEIAIAVSIDTPVGASSDILCDAQIVRNERRPGSRTVAIGAR